MAGWDFYVDAMDNELPDGQSAIYGNEPIQIWHQSAGFDINSFQVSNIISIINNPNSDSAFTIGNRRYIKLKCDLGKIICGKNGEYASAAVMSGKAILIGVGKTTPQSVIEVVNKYATYIKAQWAQSLLK